MMRFIWFNELLPNMLICYDMLQGGVLPAAAAAPPAAPTAAPAAWPPAAAST